MGLLVPVGHRLHIGKKLVELRARQSGLVITAHAAAMAVHDARDQRGQLRLLLQRQRVQNAIAIERHDVERGQALLHISQADAVCIRLALQRQNAACLIQHCLPLRGGGADAVQQQHVRALCQHIGVFDHRHRPGTRLYQLGRTNASVAILVNQVQRGTVKFNAACRAGQRHPQLLIQLCNVCDICATADGDLIDPTCPEKLPFVLLHGTRP